MNIDINAYKPAQKQLVDFRLIDNQPLGTRYALLKLQPLESCVTPLPGQFVQVLVKGVDGVMLRRPISVHDFDRKSLTLSLLVARAGRATNTLCDAPLGSILNMLLPLGNTFPLCPEALKGNRITLIGGGVGTAPLLYYGRWLNICKSDVSIVIAARTVDDVILEEEFSALGNLTVCTDDGTRGTHGFATDSDALKTLESDMWVVCGPAPMMRAVSALARKRNIECYASLENMMACGLGACLCCVQADAEGHNRCVCTEGPVFNTEILGW